MAKEQKILPEKRLTELLDPWRMTKPGGLAILLARGTRTKKLCSFDARTVRISQAFCPSGKGSGIFLDPALSL
jgi:hypothetical protein